MGAYTFKITNTETGSITELTGAKIETVLHAINNFRKQERNEPIEYMKSGKKVRKVQGLHSKEVDAVHDTIAKEILK